MMKNYTPTFTLMISACVCFLVCISHFSLLSLLSTIPLGSTSITRYSRYPELTFDRPAEEFKCPGCHNYCNCLRKRGEVYIPERNGGRRSWVARQGDSHCAIAPTPARKSKSNDPGTTQYSDVSLSDTDTCAEVAAVATAKASVYVHLETSQDVGELSVPSGSQARPADAAETDKGYGEVKSACQGRGFGSLWPRAIVGGTAEVVTATVWVVDAAERR
ncbi:hypothetical protein H4582DRAFT_1967084 [Lactarius indigo]|nr:hypothetical protein H4582DRAFT_1967084 [Lactarius indigo]